MDIPIALIFFFAYYLDLFVAYCFDSSLVITLIFIFVIFFTICVLLLFYYNSGWVLYRGGKVLNFQTGVLPGFLSSVRDRWGWR